MLYHDDLNPHATPFLVHDPLADARRHGLQFLCEAGAMADLDSLPEAARRFLDRFPDEEVILREQYLVF